VEQGGESAADERVIVDQNNLAGCGITGLVFMERHHNCDCGPFAGLRCNLKLCSEHSGAFLDAEQNRDAVLTGGDRIAAVIAEGKGKAGIPRAQTSQAWVASECFAMFVNASCAMR